MEPLSTTVFSALAKGIAGQVGTQMAGPVAKRLKQRLLGDPGQKALTRAIERAYENTRATHGRRIPVCQGELRPTARSKSV